MNTNTSPVGELNQNINPINYGFGQNFTNQAIINRNLNRFVVVDGTGNMSFVTGQTSNVERQLDNGTTTYGNIYQPYMTQTATTLTYYDVVVLRLADLHDFFKQCNSPIGQLSNFQLKLVINNGTATIGYAANNSAVNQAVNGSEPTAFYQFVPTSMTYNAASGFTNPWLVSSASCGSNATIVDGLRMFQNANGTGVTLTVTGSIGWPSNSIPCRVSIPQISISAPLLKSITMKPQRTILYEDFYVDTTIFQQPGNANLTRLIQQAISRPTRLYIIPFLSNFNKSPNGNTSLPYAYQSSLTSCPVTASHCHLRDIQIRCGGANVFQIETQKYSWQIYDVINYGLLNEGGNAVNNPLKSGLITKNMYNKCYNVYAFDIQLDSYQEEWDKPKHLNVQFTIDGNPAVYYDFILLMTYQKEIYFNTITSETDKNPNLAS